MSPNDEQLQERLVSSVRFLDDGRQYVDSIFIWSRPVGLVGGERLKEASAIADVFYMEKEAPDSSDVCPLHPLFCSLQGPQ